MSAHDSTSSALGKRSSDRVIGVILGVILVVTALPSRCSPGTTTTTGQSQ